MSFERITRPIGSFPIITYSNRTLSDMNARIAYEIVLALLLSYTKLTRNFNRARKSRTTLQNKVRLKVLPEQLTLFVDTSVTFKKCIIQ